MPELLIVYNADSGFFNAVFSSIHKVTSPETYSCSLCQVSHNLSGPLKAWRSYLEGLTIPTKPYHRDEFQKEFPEEEQRLPVILLRTDSGLSELVSAEEIDQTTNVMSLISLVDDALSNHN